MMADPRRLEVVNFEKVVGHTVDSQLGEELRRTRTVAHERRVQTLVDSSDEVPESGPALRCSAGGNIEAASSVLSDLTRIASQGVVTLLERMPREEAASLRLLFGRPIPGLVRGKAWHLALDNAKLCENKEKVINMSFHSLTPSGSNKIILLFSSAGYLLLRPSLTF